MIAGLEEISEGTLKIGDRVVNGLAPKDRDVAMAFQSYALRVQLDRRVGHALRDWDGHAGDVLLRRAPPNCASVHVPWQGHIGTERVSGIECDDSGYQVIESRVLVGHLEPRGVVVSSTDPGYEPHLPTGSCAHLTANVTATGPVDSRTR